MRRDFKLILDIIENKTKVLDLGCGNGELLELLKRKKFVVGKGIEIDGNKVSESIARGISVYQGNIEDVLKNYTNKSYDYIILSQTLHEVENPHYVINESLRIAKFVIVSFPNFGYWKIRLNVLIYGEIPNLDFFEYIWHEKHHIHPLSIADFEKYCYDENIQIVKSLYISGKMLISKYPNLFAKSGLYLISKA